MILYAAGRSPNPWKVVIILEELGLPFDMKMMASFAVLKEPEYTAINPNGRVPALIDPNKGVTLWEVSDSLHSV